MQSNDNKDEVTPFQPTSTLNLNEKTIVWLDSAYNTKRLLVVSADKGLNDIMIYSILDKNTFNYEVTISVPYYKCNKALFTKVNDELLIIASNEFRIMEWSIFRREIKHSIIIEQSPPIAITDIKLNFFKSPQTSLTLFVESEDKCLRIFSLESRSCLFLIKQFTCWALSYSGRWYITTVAVDNKTFINVHLLQDLSKQPICSLLAKNDKKIVKIEITKSNVYVLTLNTENTLSVYTLWNMEQVASMSLKNEMTDHNTLSTFLCFKENDDIIIIANEGILFGSIDKMEIIIKHKQKLSLTEIKGIRLSRFDHSFLLYNTKAIEHWI